MIVIQTSNDWCEYPELEDRQKFNSKFVISLKTGTSTLNTSNNFSGRRDHFLRSFIADKAEYQTFEYNDEVNDDSN